MFPACCDRRLGTARAHLAFGAICHHQCYLYKYIYSDVFMCGYSWLLFCLFRCSSEQPHIFKSKLCSIVTSSWIFTFICPTWKYFKSNDSFKFLSVVFSKVLSLPWRFKCCESTYPVCDRFQDSKLLHPLDLLWRTRFCSGKNTHRHTAYSTMRVSTVYWMKMKYIRICRV